MGCGPSKGTSNVYPGYKAPQQQQHFVSYGNGNALTPSNNQQQQHGGASEFVKVTLPAGVTAGQTIQVQTPNGRLNEIRVPNGLGPGSSFTVEFPPNSAAVPPPSTNPYYHNNTQPASTSATPSFPASTNQQNHGDDGFASGFNNPNWRPQAPPPEPVYASATTTDYDINSYPTTQAVPVTTPASYSTTATYQPTYPPSNNYNAYQPSSYAATTTNTNTANTYDQYAGVPSIFRPPA